ncbi:aldehyde dehydrogenase family protein [Sinosporangium siamense]|uniref:aldehyde dehydrogenase (NAD(+)) n=1 Tax=Sinosporangium siamense TaxID=1367973 RepID=A0A919RG35_9ACTN|nr:aldehyde dehydrogenase family protein [Sinosporangium siamense]GII92120.1 aldehyde dehydrogenase [Sinosporangium siamense]
MRSPAPRNLIDGGFEEPHGDEVVERVSPHDPDLAFECGSSSEEQLSRAIETAGSRGRQWAAAGPAVRSDALAALASALRGGAAGLAGALVEELGKTRREALGEIMNAARILDFYAGGVWRDTGRSFSSVKERTTIVTTREPLGVVAALAPWNFPVNLSVLKIAPALAAGNSVVLKPAPQAARSSTELAHIMSTVLPEGVLNVVQGGAGTGAALAADPRVGGVSFTGSTAVGRHVAASAAARGVPFVCEMGGKNTVVVAEDADLPAAVGAVLAGAFGMAGQKCTATSRVSVHADRYEEFLDLLLARVAEWVVGDPREESTVVGPLIDEPSRDRVLGLVEDAVAEGARMLTPAASPVPGHLRGSYLSPVVLDGVHASSTICLQEVFGPVLAVHRGKDMEEALEFANAGDYGLVGSIFTRDLGRAAEFGARLECGTVLVNQPTAGLEFHVPFAGWKGSGQGGSEQSDASLRSYSREKVSYLTW